MRRRSPGEQIELGGVVLALLRAFQPPRVVDVVVPGFGTTGVRISAINSMGHALYVRRYMSGGEDVCDYHVWTKLGGVDRVATARPCGYKSWPKRRGMGGLLSWFKV